MDHKRYSIQSRPKRHTSDLYLVTNGFDPTRSQEDLQIWGAIVLVRARFEADDKKTRGLVFRSFGRVARSKVGCRPCQGLWRMPCSVRRIMPSRLLHYSQEDLILEVQSYQELNERPLELILGPVVGLTWVPILDLMKVLTICASFVGAQSTCREFPGTGSDTFKTLGL